jgi:hypothetical protein
VASVTRSSANALPSRPGSPGSTPSRTRVPLPGPRPEWGLGCEPRQADGPRVAVFPTPSLPMTLEPHQAGEAPLVIHDPRIPLEVFSEDEEPGDLIVHGLPESVGLSAGTFRLDGSWFVPASLTPELCLMPPADFQGTLEFRLEARFDGVSESVEQDFAIEVRRTRPVPVAALPRSPLDGAVEVSAATDFWQGDRQALEAYVLDCYGDVDFRRSHWSDLEPEDEAMLSRLAELLEHMSKSPESNIQPWLAGAPFAASGDRHDD